MTISSAPVSIFALANSSFTIIKRSSYVFLILLFFIQQGYNMQSKSQEPVVGLNDNEKIYLLQLARETIATHLESGNLPRTQPVTAKVAEKFGVFVTLHENQRLRGCIGYIEGLKPLNEAVMEMAKAAAFNDFRF
ncbi:MAG: AMMECR1 domain-containing protein, partial [Calditrichaeota bacterium]